MSNPNSESSEFPVVCDICGAGTGSRSFYTHRALSHPETVKKIERDPEPKKRKKPR